MPLIHTVALARCLTRIRKISNRFNGFSLERRTTTKPLKRFVRHDATLIHRAKPAGVNESPNCTSIEVCATLRDVVDRNKPKRPRIGLALSGGAARGIAHVGVLRGLVENEIPIDCIAGTSAGALVGGAMASGMPLAEIEAIGRSLRWRDLGRMTMSRMGFQSNERLEQYLRARMPVTRFQDLPIPFAAVATDLQSGKAVIMRDEGDVPFAIRASCAIPGWYVPVTDADGRQLVDGGLIANNPSDVARSLGADLVIAVDVNAEGATFLGPSLSIISVVLQSMLLVQRTASFYQLEKADLVIKPRVGHIRWDELTRADEFISAGYDAATERIPEIKALIEAATTSVSKWYQLGRRKEIPAKRPQRSLSKPEAR